MRKTLGLALAAIVLVCGFALAQQEDTGGGGTPTQIVAGDSNITMADSGSGTATITIDSSAIGVWDVGGLTIGGADVTDQLQLPASADATTPTLAMDADGNSGLYTVSDDWIAWAFGGLSKHSLAAAFARGGFAGSYNLNNNAQSVSLPSYSFFSDTDTGLWNKGNADNPCMSSGGLDVMCWPTAASGVVRIDVTPGATGVAASMASAGEANSTLALSGSGTGVALPDAPKCGLYEKDLDGTPASTISITTGGTYVGWTTASAGITTGCTLDTADATADSITVTHAGDYDVAISMSFDNSGAITVQCCAFVNDAAPTGGPCFARELSVTSTVGNGAALAPLALAGSDEVDLRCTTNVGEDTKTIDIWKVHLVVSK